MAFRGQFGRSSTSRRAKRLTFAPDEDIEPQVHIFAEQQLRNDSGPILGESLKRKNNAIEEEKQEKLRRLDLSRSTSPDGISMDYANEVLAGNVELETSHAGGEFLAILLDDANTQGKNEKQRYKDPRTRRDRVQNVVYGFAQQLEHMVDAFMKWEYTHQEKDNRGPVKVYDTNDQGRAFVMIDIYSTCTIKTNIVDSDIGIVAELILRGIIPSSPYQPQHVFSIRAIQLFHRIHLRCPHLSIEAFVKSLSDLHDGVYKQSLTKQFSIVYDVYLQIREKIESRVAVALRRDSPRWRLQNACSACTYKLKNEPPLKFSMLTTMDGNDSLKRVLHKTVNDTDPANLVLTSRELPDGRKPAGDYYLTRDEVNRFSREEPNTTNNNSVSNASNSPSESLCAPRWNNMNKDKISRMWGVFDESGFFLSLCRHGYMLVACDMVQSGEQRKYPLAVADTLMDTVGSDIGIGYDIGCGFSKTIATSSIGQKAQEKGLTCLVGSFHGHAHNRLCQLSHLATYVTGLGLEDLEGCERFFSKSNALASSLRYASIFHRQQKIVEFMKHMDTRETSQQLSVFLVKNYKQALNIIKGEDELRQLMQRQGIENTSVFETWLEEEREYLQNLSTEPLEETFEMEYLTKLKELAGAEEKLQIINSTFIPYDPHSKKKDMVALKQYHANERVRNAVKAVQDLEDIVKPMRRWEPGTQDWIRVEQMILHRNYQRALDNLERLVVQRMFELTKINMSQSGYNLRKHIAEGLRTRADAIRTALDKYNAAACDLRPPRPTLNWDEVVQYSFLSDFDLLRDTRQDIRKRPWATPTGRYMMDQYFKILRAREEIIRLNVEIPRVITHLYDETHFLKKHEKEIATIDHVLAYQIAEYRCERTRFKDLHFQHFNKLKTVPGFSGSLEPGICIDETMRQEDENNNVMRSTPTNIPQEERDVENKVIDKEDKEDKEDAEDNDLANRFDVLMAIID